MLGQNVIIQSIGASSGIIVAGAIFTLPALYILGLETAFYKVFLSSVLGGILGIVLLIPFRKIFRQGDARQVPLPGGDGHDRSARIGRKKAANQAKLLAVAGLVGGLYDFAASTFGLWTEEISTRMTAWGTLCADKFKTLLKVNTSAAVLGLGYIIGLKYSAIIAAGSFLIWLLVVPVVGSTATGAGMSPEELYQTFGRPLGIGGIAMAGLIGIIRQSGIIKQAMGLAVSEFSGKKKAETNVPRTQRDLTMRTILTTLIAALATTFFFFQFGILGNWGQTAVALLIVFVISFLFTTVAANAIAIVGSNPVSGMTLMTLILASLVLVSIGLNGTAGMTAALIIGGVVCTALSTAGGFITDLKIGYWIGTTPKKQESWKFLGVFVSAATVAGVMIILNKTYGFGPGSPLEAPQANAMAAVIQPLMQGGTAPWVLYFCGAVLALVLTGIGIPALPFALGMFLPLQLNLPLLIGGLIAWFVSTRSKDQALNKARMSQGTLIASGFIAGGALMGVVGAILKFADVDWKLTQWNSSNAASWVGLGMYLALIIYFAVHSLRAKRKNKKSTIYTMELKRQISEIRFVRHPERRVERNFPLDRETAGAARLSGRRDEGPGPHRGHGGQVRLRHGYDPRDAGCEKAPVIGFIAPRGHRTRYERRRRETARHRELRRQGHPAERRRDDESRGLSGAELLQGTYADPHGRHDAAGRRRQGGRGGDHDRCGISARTSGAPAR